MELSEFNGEFAAIAQVEISSRILRDRLNPVQLRRIVYEICQSIHHIAVDQHGSLFLLRLIQKLLSLNLEGLILDLYHYLTRDPASLKYTVGLNITGCRSLFYFCHYMPRTKPDILRILEGIFIDMFTNSDNLSHLFDQLLMYYELTDLERLMIQIAWNFLLLSQDDLAIKNLTLFVESVGFDSFQSGVIPLIPGDLCEIAFTKQGSILLQQLLSPQVINKLSGSFHRLSNHCFGNYVVRAIFDRADLSLCILVSTELEPRFNVLITHPFGNYVVQRLIRRFKLMKIDLPHTLKWILQYNRRELENDIWGISVLRTYLAYA